MSVKKMPPSTALMRIDGTLSEYEAQVMYEWSALFRGSSRHVKAMDLSRVKDADSYLVTAAMTNRVLGLLRQGAIELESHRPLAPNEPCVLHRAAKA